MVTLSKGSTCTVPSIPAETRRRPPVRGSHATPKMFASW